MGLLGANGAGKTTLFRAIMGLIPHTGKLEVRAPHMEGAKLNSRVSYKDVGAKYKSVKSSVI